MEPFPMVSTARVVLLLDADRTLTPTDTGRAVGGRLGLNDRIRAVFERLDYTDEAFARVVDIWSAVPVESFRAACDEVAREVQLHAAWNDVLHHLPSEVTPLVITSGIGHVWRAILDRNGLAHVHLFGGCHTDLDHVYVTPLCKSDFVERLRAAGAYVFVAGDSPIDLAMLEAADVRLFVADAKGSRRLRERLEGWSGTRHFVTDHRRFAGLAPMTPKQLLRELRAAAGVHR